MKQLVKEFELSILEHAVDLVEEIQRDADRESLIFHTRQTYAEMIKYAR